MPRGEDHHHHADRKDAQDGRVGEEVPDIAEREEVVVADLEDGAEDAR